MKRGFTLIEMLIVVVVLSTLMTMVFRLSSIGGDSTARSTTISRKEKLENCLSGYYAAFGSYPPVKIHGSRDINLEVINGVQSDNEKTPNWSNEGEAWEQINAACKAQPIACNFPFGKGFSDYITQMSDEIKNIINGKVQGYEVYWKTESNRNKFSEGFDDGNTSVGTGNFGQYKDETDWRNLQLFRFGVMSFLLPRYLIMMGGNEAFYNQFAQWGDSNQNPCDPYTGKKMTWDDLKDYSESTEKRDTAKVSSIPSQAVTARWMPNLEGVCTSTHHISLFGTSITDSSRLNVDNAYSMEIYRPGGESGGQYMLDYVTVHDGWGNDFYYYSPAPYQRYTLWSAGANRRTFPVWTSREKLSSQANELIAKWVKDDITAMSN